MKLTETIPYLYHDFELIKLSSCGNFWKYDWGYTEDEDDPETTFIYAEDFNVIRKVPRDIVISTKMTGLLSRKYDEEFKNLLKRNQYA